MLSLRVLLRVPAILFWTLACHMTVVMSLPLRRFAPHLQLRIRNTAFQSWARGFARIVGMRVEVEGQVPTGPFFLVSNHLGYMDIVLLATKIHGAFIAKSELGSWPIAGHVIATAGNIFVDRGRRRDVLRVMDLVGQRLDQGLGVVLFPEGTSGKGDAILPFKPSLLNFAAKREYPVHYVSVSYSTMDSETSAQDLICWWGDAPLTPHVLRLLRLPGFHARLVFGPGPIQESERKTLASKLHQAIEEGFIPAA